MDFTVRNEGSLFMVTPVSQSAKDWVQENVSEAQWMGGAFAVEARYIADLTRGMLEAGLTGTLDGKNLALKDGEVMRDK